MTNIAKISDYMYDEKFIRAKDMSKIFVGIAPATYDGWVARGLINCYKIMGSKFYNLNEVKELIERSKV